MNRLVIAPVHDAEGALEAFIGIQNPIDRDGESDAMASVEGDSMLQELQHRLKNHLAMIVGMIRMQARREISRESFRALSHRVQSLALLYEELSPNGVASHDQQSVPAGAYLSRIANTLGAIDGRSSIRINVESEEIELPVDISARLGLLLTEFLTNALEHAFAGRREGVVRVRFQRLIGDAVRLMIEDDGMGMPDGSNWPYDTPSLETMRAWMADEPAPDGKRASGMGGTIITSMADAIGAQVNVSTGMRGTVVTVDANLGGTD